MSEGLKAVGVVKDITEDFLNKAVKEDLDVFSRMLREMCASEGVFLPDPAMVIAKGIFSEYAKQVASGTIIMRSYHSNLLSYFMERSGNALSEEQRGEIGSIQRFIMNEEKDPFIKAAFERINSFDTRNRDQEADQPLPSEGGDPLPGSDGEGSRG